LVVYYFNHFIILFRKRRVDNPKEQVPQNLRSLEEKILRLHRHYVNEENIKNPACRAECVIDEEKSDVLSLL
jgi:hypothetical protein